MKEGDVRVLGTVDFRNRRIFGGVQVFFSGVWGSIYRYTSNANTAKVVCRQLGYNTYSECT